MSGNRRGNSIACVDFWRNCNMDFDLSEEQRLLKESVDGLLGSSYDFDARKKYMAEKGGWRKSVWHNAGAHRPRGGGPVGAAVLRRRRWLRRRRGRDHDRDGGAGQGAGAGALSGDGRDRRRLPAPWRVPGAKGGGTSREHH